MHVAYFVVEEWEVLSELLLITWDNDVGLVTGRRVYPIER